MSAYARATLGEILRSPRRGFALHPSRASHFSRLAFLTYLPHLTISTLFAAFLTARAPAQPNLPLLTTAREVLQLTSDQAALGYPVRLRPVITFCDEPQGQLFVQDDTGGIFVEIHGAYAFQMHRGQRLEIEGVSARGGFAPDIVPRQIHLLGEVPLPPLRVVSFDQMAAGQQDCNWVEFRGVVRSVSSEPYAATALKLASGGGGVMVPIKDPDSERCAKLVDAEVTVRGVCIAHFNERGQLIQVAVQVSNMDDISVRKPAPADPFTIATRKISNLLRYSPGADAGHRVKVQGVVTLQRPGEVLCIADETQGLYIQTTQTNGIVLGDRVEVLGFPESGEFISPTLQDGVFRKVGTGPPPAALKIAAEDAVHDTNHAALVEIEARVLQHVERRHARLLELHSGNIVFDAVLSAQAEPDQPLGAIPDGSRVLVTGVCLVPEQQNWLLSKPRSFSLLLRSAADVALLQRPSWWTARHALWVLAALLAVFCASLAWVVVLRKQVQAQTKVIAQKIQREAALEERTRIARDLHDDLGASLTHIGFLSEVARKEKPASSAVVEHLREISGSTQQAFQSLDQIVWVVNPVNDTLDNLVSYLCHFAVDFFRDTTTRCRFDVPASVPDRPLPTELRNNIFFAVKEALNNVRKHAAASEITLGVKISPAPGKSNGHILCSIRIEDNGRGFAPGNLPSDRNGLINMRQRLENIHGTFTLDTHPGLGTKIFFTVPI